MNCLRAFTLLSCRRAVLGKNLFSALAFFCLIFATQFVRANVYPTNIRLQGIDSPSVYFGRGDSLQVSYVLNEAASGGVTVEILLETNLVRTIEVPTGPGTIRGSNVVIWDGKDEIGEDLTNQGPYSIRITARSEGFLDWTQITDDSNPGNYVYEPRAIAVNCNSNSPYYGRIFVGNSHANPGSSAQPGDLVGILKLNADASPAAEGGFSDGGYAWEGDFFSPWKIEVSADDKVYVNDWTRNGTVLAFDQVISTNYLVVLSTNNWPIVGTNDMTGVTNYANLSGPFITGSGTNTQIWMADISFNQDTNIAKGVGVRRWNTTIDGTVAEGDLGTTIIQAGGPDDNRSDLNLYPYDLSVDKNGKIYVIQYRANPNDTANKVFCFPAYDESGVPQKVAEWKVGGANNLVGAFGIAVNRDATLVAVALREGGCVVVLDAATGTNVTTINVALGHDRRDVAWDNVGNLYSVDNLESIWRAFSPPGTNQATTVAVQTVQIIEKPVLTSPACDGMQFQFLLCGQTNLNYVIQASVDLMNWTAVSTNFLTNSPQEIHLDGSSDQQFYRAALAP